MKRNAVRTLATALILALALPAFAGSIAPEDRMEVAAVLKAPITPIQAVKIAENGGGRACGCSQPRGEDAQGAHALDGSKLTLAEAITRAERVGHGPALEASAAGHGDQAHVDVDVIQDQGKRVAHYRVSIHGGQIRAAMTGTDS
jgi:hypothetical protein